MLGIVYPASRIAHVGTSGHKDIINAKAAAKIAADQEKCSLSNT
jgi:hypothetical protein